MKRCGFSQLRYVSFALKTISRRTQRRFARMRKSNMARIICSNIPIERDIPENDFAVKCKSRQQVWRGQTFSFIRLTHKYSKFSIFYVTNIFLFKIYCLFSKFSWNILSPDVWRRKSVSRKYQNKIFKTKLKLVFQHLPDDRLESQRDMLSMSTFNISDAMCGQYQEPSTCFWVVYQNRVLS